MRALVCFIGILLQCLRTHGGEIEYHPTRVIIGYEDDCTDSPITALRSSPLVSPDEVSIVTAVVGDDTATPSNALNSFEDMRKQSLHILASLLFLRNNGIESCNDVALVAAANAEKVSLEYFEHLKMEVIEDPEGQHASDELAALAEVLPCMAFPPEMVSMFPTVLIPELPAREPQEDDFSIAKSLGGIGDSSKTTANSIPSTKRLTEIFEL